MQSLLNYFVADFVLFLIIFYAIVLSNDETSVSGNESVKFSIEWVQFGTNMLRNRKSNNLITCVLS